MALRTRTNVSQSSQAELFHDDLNSALRGLFSVLGGAKQVGTRLYPELTAEAAGRKLLNATDTEHAQQLSHMQFMTLLRWAREAGYHSLVEWICDDLGYTRPKALSPEDERAELQRQVLDMGSRLENLMKRLQK